MSTTREELRNAVNTLLNDVIEQSFSFLIHHPQKGDALNKIIKETTDELNYFLVKIDAHNFPRQSQNLAEHYNQITHEVHRRSLELMSQLQQLQKKASSNVVDE